MINRSFGGATLQDIIKILAPSLLTAVVTLLGATALFGWQKRFDRRTEHSNYLREIYAEFLSVVLRIAEAAESASDDQHAAGLWERDPLGAEMRRIFQRIHLSAPEKERNAARELSMVCGGLIVGYRLCALRNPDAPGPDVLANWRRELMEAVDAFVETVRSAQNRHLGASRWQ